MPMPHHQPEPRQLAFELPYSPEAAAALDAIVEHLLGGSEPNVPARVWAELDERGDLDAWHELETEGAIDWADPDAHDLDTLRWYDESADPYNRGPEPLDGCEFMLGSHRPNWLYDGGSRAKRPDGPLFVSARQLKHARRTAYPACDTRFCIDSGGFTELRKHGGWVTTPEEYVAQVRALAAQTGSLDWAAIQDWMVEDDALRCTGLSIEEHQRRTVASFLRLRELAPEIRWLPVIQGQNLEQYEAHVAMYREAGVWLQTMHRVGVGSVCRRQSTSEIEGLLAGLAARGLKLHGFGVKTQGLRAAAEHLASADSLAWSLDARRAGEGKQNCQHVAEDFRAKMRRIEGVL